MTASPLDDPVPRDLPIARDVGFELPERYNASEILFGNLEAGRGGRTAVRSPAGDASYAELCADACRAGNALRAMGLEPPGRVLMLLHDTAVYPAAIFGAIRAGLVPVLINTQSNADLLGYYLADSAAEVAIVEHDLCPLITAETAAGSKLKTVVVAGGPVPDGLPVAAAAWPEWIAAAPAELEAAPTGRDDMAFWMYSSGSTGRPKGIVHLQHDMAYTHRSYAREILEIGESDVCFSPPKLFFAYGFGNALTFPFAAGGGAVLYPGRPEPEAVFDCVERYRPTIFFGLPTLYNALANHPRFATADMASVRLFVSAAETLSAELFTAWHERFGRDIVEGLGSTEMLHIYLSNRPEAKKLGSVGKPVRGYEVRLLDPDGREVRPGEAGVLWVRGDSSAPCYWNKPEKTAETMRDDWIYTGDRFLLDEDGFLFFRGRADDLIKVSGQWVYPLEIEVCLADHPAVRECAVLGVELPDRRMTTKAFVVLEGTAAPDEATARALQDFVKERLLPYKYPRLIEYLEALPKTGTGKIDRQKLLARDAEEA